VNELTAETYQKGVALADKFLAQLEGVGKAEALVAFAACLGMVASELQVGPSAVTILDRRLLPEVLGS
jgi:hypothetical protein